jgi:hypothetical protein
MIDLVGAGMGSTVDARCLTGHVAVEMRLRDEYYSLRGKKKQVAIDNIRY